MKSRMALLLPLCCAAVVFVGGCKKEPEPPKPPPSISQGTGQDIPANAVAGVTWTIPSRWSAHPPRQMRFATYMVPSKDADREGGECAVFYFGSGQGGDVQANIDRWIGQFESAGAPDQAVKEVNGMKVTTVAVSGTYLSPGGPMMQSQGKKENYRLLGAIVEAPEGSVFFKFTGPSATVEEAQDEFDALVESVKKQ